LTVERLMQWTSKKSDFEDPEIADVWVSLAPVVDVTLHDIRHKDPKIGAGCRVFPGSTPVAAIPSPAIRMKIKVFGGSHIHHRSGPLLFNPEHWQALFAA
jgi:hypothetical protein